MNSLMHKLLLMTLALVIALPLVAAQNEKEKKKKKGEPGAIGAVKKALADVDLNEEQQKKVDEILAKYKTKLQDAQKKAGEAPKKVAEARKKLQGEGKKGRELAAAVKAEAKLTDEEQAAVDELESLNRELRSEIEGVLTDEQKEKAGLTKKKRKKNG